MELHVGRPLLWEIDEFLRREGFVLLEPGRVLLDSRTTAALATVPNRNSSGATP